MRIARKLNIVHIIHFTLTLTAVFVVNLFILKEVAYRNLLGAFTGISRNLDHYIDTEFHSIEENAFLVGEALLNHPDEKTAEEKLIRKLHPNIQDIEVIENKEVTPSFAAPGYVQFVNNSLNFQMDSVHQLNVQLSGPWLNDLLTDFLMNYPYAILIVDRNQNVLFSNSEVKEVESNFIADNKFDQLAIQNSDNGEDRKNLYIFDDNTRYLAHVNYNKHLNAFTITYIQNNKVFSFLRHYPLVISIIFVLVLFFLLGMVVRTNIRFTRPISRVANNLRSLNGNQSNTAAVDDVLLIQRTVDALQNQVEFYTQNLEKSSAIAKKLEKDIQVAKQLQRNILPKNTGEISQREEFLIYADSEAVFEIGGDFYDYFLLDSNHLMFVIADIAGKGIPASLFTIFTHTLLRTIAKPELSASEIINRLNNKLIENNISDLFVTMILGVLNTETGVVEFSNAAHNMPLLIKENGEIKELPDTHGIPLGIYANRDYESSTLQLEPSDQLLFYTDGLMDAKDENGMSFSLDVLRYNLMGAWFKDPREIVTKIQHDMQSFRGTADPVDDMTLMVLKYIHRNNS